MHPPRMLMQQEPKVGGRLVRGRNLNHSARCEELIVAEVVNPGRF